MASSVLVASEVLNIVENCSLFEKEVYQKSEDTRKQTLSKASEWQIAYAIEYNMMEKM